MATIDRQSNFEIFQDVLRKSKKRPSAGKAVVGSPQSMGELSYSTLSPIENVGASDSQEDKDALPFLRQTFRWDRRLQRSMQVSEVPKEDWTAWVSVDVKKGSRFRVRQQREFDESGVKVKDCLVLLGTSEILQEFWDFTKTGSQRGTRFFLRQHSDSSSEDDYDPPPHHREISISHERYKDLFFRIVEYDREAFHVYRTLGVLQRFIDHVFPGARKVFEESDQGIRISYSHIWTLFQPGTIVYEKRLVPTLNEAYEQCFRVRSTDDSVSHADGNDVFRLVLEEVVYMQGDGVHPGPRVILTSRQIRKYNGCRNVTTEDLGVVPLSDIPKERQREIGTAIEQRSREFLRLSALSFSIWNYRGPVGLSTPVAGPGTLEQTKLPQAKRVWQSHTHENVVIDLRSSAAYFNQRFPGWLYSIQDGEDHIKNTLSIPISRIEHSEEPVSKHGNYAENVLLICRGYLPAYLISSRMHAVNVLVSELTLPIWDQPTHWGSANLSPPNGSHWYTLCQAYFEEGEEMETKLGRRQTRGAGLVLGLQGPKILTTMAANNISSKLKRPLVSLSLAEEHQRLSEASKQSLKWGGFLHIDQHGVPNNQWDARGIELAGLFSFYPSVVLVTCNDVTELGAGCENEIDGVIACNTLSDDPILELWRLYLTTELPEVSASVSEQRLNDACRILAKLEPRESRMRKTLKTAKRIAVAETSAVRLGHVLAVIRSSLSSARLEEVKDILATVDELGPIE